MAVGAGLGLVRYRAAAVSPGPDFVAIFIPAAQAVAAGGSPYQVQGYYYTPLVALLLAPFSHSTHAWQVWVATMVAAGLAACVLGVRACGNRLPQWQQGLLTLVAIVTLLYSWPATLGLWLGLPDLLVVASLAGAALFHAKGRGLGSGVSLGSAALVKTWPAVFALWLVRRPARGRRAEWVGVIAAAAVAGALALAVGGWPAMVNMVASPFRASDQPLAAYSVWGVPKILFTNSGIAEPLVVSPLLFAGLTVVLALWAISLLVLVIWHPGNPVTALYNTVFVIVLLLPVSHLVYLMYPLGALWCWLAAGFAPGRPMRSWLTIAVLGVWWFVSFRIAPTGDGVASITWPSLVLIFASTLIAATTSVLAAAWPGLRKLSSAGGAAPAP